MASLLTFSKRIAASFGSPEKAAEWERLIAALLEKLELDCDERARAETAYHELGRQIEVRFGLAEGAVEVFPQGSMRTQTTISPRGKAKFDLDVVVRFNGHRFESQDPEAFFASFGEALAGNERAGHPKPKRRCWRLQYPGEPFYFDVTPALPAGSVLAAPLRVRDPQTGWSPSNPVEFADWFCDRASRRFPFQTEVRKSAADAMAHVEPLPSDNVRLDDVLRRVVQLVKLHRDNLYWTATEETKAAQPISVIIVTTATRAYEHLLGTRPRDFATALELALAVVEEMPQFVERVGGRYSVPNPALPSENFADRWNSDGGLRAREFAEWHTCLERDLELLFAGPTSQIDEARIRSVFGSYAVDEFRKKRSQPSRVLAGLIAGAPTSAPRHPSAPVKVGSRGTLA